MKIISVKMFTATWNAITIEQHITRSHVIRNSDKCVGHDTHKFYFLLLIPKIRLVNVRDEDQQEIHMTDFV